MYQRTNPQNWIKEQSTIEKSQFEEQMKSQFTKWRTKNTEIAKQMRWNRNSKNKWNRKSRTKLTARIIRGIAKQNRKTNRKEIAKQRDEFEENHE